MLQKDLRMKNFQILIVAQKAILMKFINKSFTLSE